MKSPTGRAKKDDSPRLQNIPVRPSSDLKKLARGLLGTWGGASRKLTADYSEIERSMLERSLKRKKRDGE